MPPFSRGGGDIIKAGLVNKYVCLFLYITDKNVHITDSLKREQQKQIVTHDPLEIIEMEEN